MTGEGGDAGMGLGSMRALASQDGSMEGANSMVIPGRRVEGKALRCSIKVTWKELKIFPIVTSQRQ
jgi:hypothetical protein